MMPAVIRIGDPGSHGGSVISGSPDTTVNGIAVARVGDQTACGATLQGGSPDVEVN